MTNGTKRYIETIEWLGKVYDFVNEKLFKNELVRPVITVQVDNKNHAYGWITRKRMWKEDVKDEGEYEINISAQFLNRPWSEIAETLIHEMCHQHAKANNLQDTSRSGSYHNKLFKKIAEDHGLKVEKVVGIGWSGTSLTDKTFEILSVFFAQNPIVPIYREPIQKACRVKSSSTRKYVCPMCGMSVRATKVVRIMCVDCDELMSTDD